MLSKSVDDMWTKSWFTKESIGKFLFATYFSVINSSSVNTFHPIIFIYPNTLYNTYMYIYNYILFYFKLYLKMFISCQILFLIKR